MKSGKNSKQAEQLRALAYELQNKKKQLLQCSITLQSIQNHNATLIIQNNRMIAQLAAIKAQSDCLIRNQNMHIKILQDRNKTLLIQKRDIQIKCDTMRITYQATLAQFQEYKITKDSEICDIKQHYDGEIFAMKSTQVDYQNAISEFQKVNKEVNQIKQLRQSQQQSFKTHIANIERQKIQSIDIVKKQMLNKACEMRNKALQIRKQQLQVTTRLTFLQNDQLVRQLEYQSAKTEQILRRNAKLEQEVKQLKRCIEINQEVQKEIMKRNVVAKNVIASLNQEVKQHKRQNSKVQDQKGIIKLETSQKQSKINETVYQVEGKQKVQEPQRKSKSLKDKSQQQNTVQVLKQYVRNLQSINEGHIKQIQQLKNENKKLKKQLKVSSHNQHQFQSCDNIASLLMRFLDQIVRPLKTKHNNQVQSQDNKETIDALKDIHVDKWSTESVQKIVKLILNALRPYLTMKVLKLPYFQDSLQKKSSCPDYQNLKQNNYASKYIEALKRQKNRSLDNIKSRSVSYMLDEAQKKKKVSNHRRISKAEPTLQPVAKRFIKPHLLNRI